MTKEEHIARKTVPAPEKVADWASFLPDNVCDRLIAAELAAATHP